MPFIFGAQPKAGHGFSISWFKRDAPLCSGFRREKHEDIFSISMNSASPRFYPMSSFNCRSFNFHRIFSCHFLSKSSRINVSHVSDGSTHGLRTPEPTCLGTKSFLTAFSFRLALSTSHIIFEVNFRSSHLLERNTKKGLHTSVADPDCSCSSCCCSCHCSLHFLSCSFIFFHVLSFSFIFFVFVGCSKSDFFWASISLRFLLTVLM